MNGQVTFRMLLRGTLLLVVALAAAGAQTQMGEPAADEATTGPRIEFSALEHDFGEADSGVNLEKTFVFKNSGDEILIIEKVTSG
jgi:hypothetical protein